LEAWRNEIASVRNLAENDAVLANKKAQILKDSLPANAMPADKAKVLNLLARTELYTAQTSAAANHARLALNMAKQYSDRIGQAEAYLNMSLNAVNQGEIDVIIDASPRALEVLQGMDNPALLSEAMLRLAMMYLRLGQLDATVTLCMQTMDVAKRSNDPLALLYAHQGLGIAFNNNGRYTEAHEHFTQMRDLARAIKLRQPEGEAISGMAFTLAKLGDWRTAVLMHREAIALFRSVGVPFNTAHALYSLADTMRQHGLLTDSLQTLSETISLYQRYPNKIGLWWTLVARSENYQGVKNLALARADAERAYTLAQNMSLLLYRAESAKRMAAITAATGEHKRAYQFATEAADLTDQMTREKSSARMVDLAQRYQSESKQRKIDELTRNEQHRELEQRWLWTILGGSIILLAGSGYFLLRLRNSHRLLQTSNAQLRQSQDEIRALNFELEQRVQTSTAELRQQSRYLRTLFDTLPISVWLKDTAGRYLTINTSHVAVKGLTAEKMIGKTDEELWPGDIGSAFRAADIEVMETRHRKTQELAIPAENGTIFWREIDKAPVIDEDGTVIGTVGVGRDISERKRYEQSLLAQAKLEQRLSALTSNIPGFVYTLRLEPDGHTSFPFASAGLEEIFGLRPEEIRDDADVLRAHYHPDDLPRMFNTMEESERTLKPFHAEIRIRDRNNEERWVEVRSIPQRQPNGGTEWHGIMLDITERKLAERQLKQALEFSEGIISAIPDILFEVDRNGKYLNVWTQNPELLAAQKELLLGKTAQEVLSPEAAAAAMEAIREADEKGTSVARDMCIDLPHGRFWFAHSMAKKPGNTPSEATFMVLSRDITERKRMEDELAAREREFRALAESSPGMMGSFYLRPDGVVCMPYVSPNIYELFGLHPQDITEDASSLLMLNHPDDAQRVRESIVESAKTMTVWHQEYRILHPTKGVRWMESNTNPQPHPDGGTVWYGYVFDITERKQTEQKLKEALEFNEGVINAIPDLLFELNRDGRYLNVWTHTPELLAAQNELLLNNTVHDVLSPESAAVVMETLREAEERGLSLGKVIQIDLPHGGGWFELSVSKKPGSSPSAATFLVLSRDITARKRTKEVLSFIAQGEWLNSGEVFLNALVRYLGKMLDVDYVLIDKIATDPAYAETVALYANGEVAPNMRYALQGTPCANVISGSLCSYSENVQAQFPEDILLVEMGAQSYVGLPLWDTKGNAIGLIAVLDNKPMTDTSSVKSILQLVATSAAAELKRTQMEQVLRESHESLREAQRISHVGNWTLDLVADTLHWSDEIYRIFEIEPEQFDDTYDAWLNFIHPEEREAVDHAYTESVKNHAPYEIEHRILLADGRIKFVHERCETIYDQGGKALRSIGTVQDITERKQMEVALNESESRYRYHFNLLQSMLESASSVSVFALDRDYRYLFFNNRHREGAKRIRGTDIAIGMSMVESIPDAAFREFCRQGFDRVLAGNSIAVESKEAVVKDGVPTYEYNDNFGSPIFDDKGAVIGLTVFAINTTERKQLEAELRASRNFLDSVIDSVSDPIFVKDRQHRWTLLNDAFCAFIGKPREVLLGKSDHDFFPAEEAKVFWAKDELVFESKESNLNEERFTAADGEEHYIQTKKTPFVAGDGREMLVGIIRDITELKRYESAREAALTEAVRLAKSRSEFLAHMSHELRTPLNGILGYTQILQRSKALGERNADALNVIRQSGEHLLALIEDILDLARIEAGRFKLDLSDIALATFLRVVTDIIRVRAKEKNIEFACDFSRDLPAGIRGDDKRLRQVLLNLLSNAVKFTEHGRVTLHVSKISPSHLAFKVEDTGMGIPANELETIFQPFEQSGDTQQRFGGSGLGLSISRKLVRLMGGDITVESKPGEGSTFRFELELPEVKIAPVALLSEPVAREQAIPSSLHTSAEPLILPPAEELQTLHHLAQLGNMRDIIQYAERIATTDSRYQPFSDHLRRMAEGYQSKAILAFVEEHLNDTKK
jgi:PAS domain S-box-containing protein